MKPHPLQRILALLIAAQLALPGPAAALRQEPPIESDPAVLTGLEEDLSSGPRKGGYYEVPLLGRKLRVTDGLLLPSDPSTELFIRFIQEHSELFRGKQVLEIGCGCGPLTIVLARAGAFVTAVDILPEAVDDTRSNLETESPEVQARVLALGVSDVYDALPTITDGKNPVFDVVVSAHPILNRRPASFRDFSTHAGAHFETPKRILAGLPTHLKPGGSYYSLAELEPLDDLSAWGFNLRLWSEGLLRSHLPSGYKAAAAARNSAQNIAVFEVASPAAGMEEAGDYDVEEILLRVLEGLGRLESVFEIQDPASGRIELNYKQAARYLEGIAPYSALWGDRDPRTDRNQLVTAINAAARKLFRSSPVRAAGPLDRAAQKLRKRFGATGLVLRTQPHSARKFWNAARVLRAMREATERGLSLQPERVESKRQRTSREGARLYAAWGAVTSGRVKGLASWPQALRRFGEDPDEIYARRTRPARPLEEVLVFLDPQLDERGLVRETEVPIWSGKQVKLKRLFQRVEELQHTPQGLPRTIVLCGYRGFATPSGGVSFDFAKRQYQTAIPAEDLEELVPLQITLRTDDPHHAPQSARVLARDLPGIPAGELVYPSLDQLRIYLGAQLAGGQLSGDPPLFQAARSIGSRIRRDPAFRDAPRMVIAGVHTSSQAGMASFHDAFAGKRRATTLPYRPRDPPRLNLQIMGPGDQRRVTAAYDARSSAQGFPRPAGFDLGKQRRERKKHVRGAWRILEDRSVPADEVVSAIELLLEEDRLVSSQHVLRAARNYYGQVVAPYGELPFENFIQAAGDRLHDQPAELWKTCLETLRKAENVPPSKVDGIFDAASRDLGSPLPLPHVQQRGSPAGLEELTEAEREIILHQPLRRQHGDTLRLTGEIDLGRVFGLSLPWGGSSPVVPVVPNELYEGKDVLVVPGYGNLPFLLKELGAGSVVGIDMDPVTIAWQKARAWYGQEPEVAEQLKRFEDPPYEIAMGSVPFRRLRELVEHKPLASPQLSGIRFTQGSVLSLPAADRQFDLVVVPYLFAMPHGIQDMEDLEAALRELLRVTRPGGSMLILPSERDRSILETYTAYSAMEAFSNWLHSRSGDLTITRSEPFPLMNYGPQRVMGRYTILRTAAPARPAAGMEEREVVVKDLRVDPARVPPAQLPLSRVQIAAHEKLLGQLQPAFQALPHIQWSGIPADPGEAAAMMLRFNADTDIWEKRDTWRIAVVDEGTLSADRLPEILPPDHAPVFVMNEETAKLFSPAVAAEMLDLRLEPDRIYILELRQDKDGLSLSIYA